jgi:hypothetical protein
MPALPHRLDEARINTSTDTTLQKLKIYISNGWPQQRSQVAQECKEFWNYKEELVLEDGLIFKGERMVIPLKLQPKFLSDLHKPHMGEEKTKLLARETVFWPGINTDIVTTVKQCLPCQESRPSQQTQTLNSHDVPARAWQKVGADLFSFGGGQFLLIADYYSNYPFIRLMKSTTSSAVITCMKTIFSEHGTPQVVFTDQGPQFHCREFQQFSMDYGFRIEHSSPRYPQANGFIEAMVKVIKDLFTRAVSSGEDSMLAIQAYRATPLNGKTPSPAEMMFGRKIQTVLPIRTNLTTEQQATRDIKIQAKLYQQHNYDKHAKEYQELQQYQKVLVQLDHEKQVWRPATVIDTPSGLTGPRTYTVQTSDGAQYPRNRKYLRPSEAGASSTQIPSGITETSRQVHQRAGDVDPPLSKQLDVQSVPPSPKVTPHKVSRGSLEVPAPTPRPSRDRVPPKLWSEESLLPRYAGQGKK